MKQAGHFHWKLVPRTTSLDLVVKQEFCKLVVTMIQVVQSTALFQGWSMV
jgi:hypothetical protein